MRRSRCRARYDTPGISDLMRRDGLDGRHRVAAKVNITGGLSGKGQRVEDQIVTARDHIRRRPDRGCDGQPRASTSTSRAWPRSSISRQITAAPCSRANARTPCPSSRVRQRTPSSRLAELRTQRPPRRSSPASITSGSVESSTTAAVISVAKRRGEGRHVGYAVPTHIIDAEVHHDAPIPAPGPRRWQRTCLDGHRRATHPERPCEPLALVLLADDEERRVLA